MQRIKTSGRRYGRGESPVATGGTTHAIKIGWKTSNAKGAEYPMKLAGFLITRDTLDKDNKPVIDYDAMRRLGYLPEAVSKALKDGFKADEGLLPTRLTFVLMNDATRDGDQWVFPGTINALYECYNPAEHKSAGLFCYGDGEHAIRKALDKNNNPDGTKRQLQCNPIGKAGIAPENFCPFSTRKECRLHARLSVCLYYTTEANKPQPLFPELGMQARARLDTSSEYAEMDALSVLDAAADRLNGHLNGITGSLMFTRKARRSETGKQIVGHITFMLDEEAICARERQMQAERDKQYDRQIEAGKAGVTLQLDAPRTITVERGAGSVREFATVDADPFDASPAETKAPVNETEHAEAETVEAEPVEDSADRELAARVEAYARATARPEFTFEQILGAMVAQAAPNIKTLNLTVKGVEWFFSASNAENARKRIEILRKLPDILKDDPAWMKTEPVAATVEGEEI